MGKLFDEFGDLTFNNEAEVSQKFILPLLQKYLGYKSNEIIPEKAFPAKTINSGVRFSEGGSKGLLHKPDFVVCFEGDIEQPKFIIDSKGPHESIDDHLGQLRSYALSVGKNLLMMTNGTAIKVFDVNELLFYSKDVADLQTKIDTLISLLGRTNQSLKSTIDILKELSIEKAIGHTVEDQINKEIKRRKILLSDFEEYLQNLVNNFSNWHLPSQHFQALNNLELSKIDPNLLLTFQLHGIDPIRSEERKQFKLHSLIENNQAIKVRVFSGETGTGKSCMLKYLAYQAATKCLSLQDVRIPIFISLREIGHHYKIEDLIIASLNRNGYCCKTIFDLPSKNEFIFYLDAYDEIGELFISQSFQAIEHISANFSCFITTRPNRIPSFKPSIIFDLLPISEWQMKRIIQKHIGNQYYEFERHLKNTQMIAEAGNILLLLCLISIFKESNSLPSTITKVMDTVVGRVREWQNSKRHQADTMMWEITEAFLSAIACRIVESGQTVLSKIEAEVLLLDTLKGLEGKRKIKGSVTISLVIDSLLGTGILMDSPDHLYFWHRLFLEHFASLGLKGKYDQDRNIISSLVDDERWHVAILGLVSLLNDSTSLVSSCKKNFWFSVLCLSENSQCDESVVKNIADRLLNLATSTIPEIRVRASVYLTKIEHQYVVQLLYLAIEKNLSAEIKMFSLRAIGKTKSEKARNIIYEHISWDDSSFFLGRSSQSHIARALYYYGEPDHLQIIENWKVSNDYLMNKECRRIFIDLYGQGKLTDEIIRKLRELFLEILYRSKRVDDKVNELAEILILVPDNDFALRALDAYLNTDGHGAASAMYNLLKGLLSLEIIEELKSRILIQGEKDSFSGDQLLDVICHTEYPVPKEVYLELAKSSNVNISSKAIMALSRFSFGEVKQVIEEKLYGDNPQLQSAALKVLMENGEIIDLIRGNKFPDIFYIPTAHTLLKGIRRYNLFDALHLVEAIFLHLEKESLQSREFGLGLHLAGTYYFLGQRDRHLATLAWYFDGDKLIQPDKYVHQHLMNHLKYYEPDAALQIALGYFKTYFPFNIEDGGYKMGVFLEAAEDLARNELVPCIKQIIDDFLGRLNDSNDVRYHLERPMRALVVMAERSDEEWVLERLEMMKNERGFDFPELRRATECLALVGSIKSLPYIKKIALQCKDKALVLNTCQIAYERICQRENIALNGDLFEV